MAKKPRTAKQLANDERLRNKSKQVAPTTAPPLVPDEEEEFVPTQVKEAQGQATGGQVPADIAALAEPAPLPNVAPQPVVDEAPSSPPLPIAPQVDPNLVATIVAAMAAIQGNPQYQQMKPEEKLNETVNMNPNAARITAGQGVQGVVYRYPVEKSHYPDPTQRLINEPKLARFALAYNYRFRWSVDGETFEKHGITYAEPRFTLELFRLIYDENGEPTGTMALVARQMQHEDDFTVRVAAERLGIADQFEHTDEGFKALQDEIRYWRIQQWLFGIFTPPKIQTFRRAPKTQVIAGKVVEVFDSEELTDHDSGIAAASTIKSQVGIGGVPTPDVKE